MTTLSSLIFPISVEILEFVKHIFHIENNYFVKMVLNRDSGSCQNKID